MPNYHCEWFSLHNALQKNLNHSAVLEELSSSTQDATRPPTLAYNLLKSDQKG